MSRSQEEAEKRYIVNQAEHHQQADFKSELLRLRTMDFDERFVLEGHG